MEFIQEENLVEDLGSVSKLTTSFKMNKQNLRVTMWKPKADPKALLFICHGLGDYISPVYETMARVMSSNGILVFAHDHMGHGHSSGPRVQIINSIEEDYVNPVIEHCAFRKKQNQGLKLIILGHSMGGFVAANAILKRTNLFDLAIMTAPFVEANPEMATPFKVFVAKWLCTVLPNMTIGGVPEDQLTRDKIWEEKIRNDPLMWHSGVKLRLCFEALRASNSFGLRMKDLSVPILIQQGTCDVICTPSGSKKLHSSISSQDKALKLYQGAFHTLFAELPEVRDQLVADQLAWIEERL